MTKQRMKLFVWEGVLADYTEGIAFAIARNVFEAKKALIDGGVYDHKWKGCNLDGVKASVHDVEKMTTPKAFHVWGGG